MNKLVKVFCHTCDGEGFVEETSYPGKKQIRVICPECNGNKYVMVEGLIPVE